MVGFTKKKVKSRTLGEKLRQIREEARVSLAEISKYTKIRVEYLEKIEREDFDNLPPEVYVKGFLKSYAQYLGLDSEEVVRQYEKERGIQANLKKIHSPKENKLKFNFPIISITPRAFSFSIFIILILAGFFYFYQELEKFSRNPRLIILQPAADTFVKNSSVEIMGITDQDSKVTINNQPVFVNDKGEFKESIGLQQGFNKISVKSINRFNKENEKEINVSADYELKVAGEESVNPPLPPSSEKAEPDKIKMEIAAKENSVWIEIKTDGEKTFSGVMPANTTQVFEAENQISISSGKANQTFIKFNGNDFGVLGENQGVIRDVVFSKDGRFPVKDDLEKNKE